MKLIFVLHFTFEFLCVWPDLVVSKHDVLVGALLEDTDEHLLHAFEKSCQLFQEEFFPDGEINLYCQVLSYHQQNHSSALENACKILEKPNLIGVIGPVKSGLADLIGQLISVRKIPYFKQFSDYEDNISNEDILSMGSTLRMYPAREHAMAIRDFIQVWRWTHFFFVYSDPSALQRFHVLLSTLWTVAETKPIRIQYFFIQNDNFLETNLHLKEVGSAEGCIMQRGCYNGSIPNLIIVDLQPEQYQKYFTSLLQLGMVNGQYWYFFTSLNFRNHDLHLMIHNYARVSGISIDNLESQHFPPDVPAEKMNGILNESLVIWNNTRQYPGYIPYLDLTLLVDSLLTIVRGLKVGQQQGLSFQFPSNKCDKDGVKSNWLPHIFNSMKPQHGLSGRIEFQNGVRKNLSLDSWEVESFDTQLLKTGRWSSEKRFKIFPLNQIGSRLRNKKKELRISVILVRPYVSLKQHHESFEGNEKYEGFCVDMIGSILNQLHIPFVIHVVNDNEYGSKTDNGSWTGMIGELTRNEADLALGPLTITYDRAQVVDFTKPFLQIGISMLMRVQHPQSHSFLSFLHPLSPWIWWGWITAFILSSFIFFFAGFISPYEKNYKPSLEQPIDLPENGKEDNEIYELHNDLSFGASVWLMVCVVLRASSDTSPKTISTRLATGAWWVLSSILLATYTANFSAILAVERRYIPIRGFDDLANQTKFSYGCLKGGSTCKFFEKNKMLTFQRLWENIKRSGGNRITSNGEGVEQVLNKDFIYLIESATLEFEVMQNCNLTGMPGLVLGSRGYGLALRKGSPLTDRLSGMILHLSEIGLIPLFKNLWWVSKRRANCLSTPISVSVYEERHSISIYEVAGLFIALAVGSLVALFIACAEFFITSIKFDKRQSYGAVFKDMFSTLAWAAFCGTKLKYVNPSPKITRVRRSSKRRQQSSQRSNASRSEIKPVLRGDIMTKNFCERSGIVGSMGVDSEWDPRLPDASQYPLWHRRQCRFVQGSASQEEPIQLDTVVDVVQVQSQKKARSQSRMEALV